MFNRNDYQREWMRKRRHDFFKDKTCAKCNVNINLEIHHVDRKTKISHKIWSWSAERRIAELTKCIILCEDCHQQETNKQIKNWASKPITHGTQSGYRRGCRCLKCKSKYSEARKKHYIVTGN